MSPSDTYDALIVGAGPAGAQCARDLSKKGRRILLIEKAKDFSVNNYSSGGAPQELMERFDLPSDIVGTFWKKFIMKSASRTAIWESNNKLGPILDFDKLRKFLTDDAVRHGTEFHLGCSYVKHTSNSQGELVNLKEHATGHERTVLARLLVDASGSERRVLAGPSYNKQNAVAATGIEYHLKVPASTYSRFSETLHFFLGPKWMPQGYSWIFPMGQSKLKVGAIRYFLHENIVPHHHSFDPYLDQLIELCGGRSQVQFIDRHGKTIHFTKKQQDQRTNGRVIAIGDAISAVNPLGGEGIRHAMFSAELAANSIEDYLINKTSSLDDYDRKIDNYFGIKWRLCEWMMHSLYKMKRDALFDYFVDSCVPLTTTELLDLTFQYKIPPTIKAFSRFFLKRLTHPFS